jgi:hypothetical protein
MGRRSPPRPDRIGGAVAPWPGTDRRARQRRALARHLTPSLLLSLLRLVLPRFWLPGSLWRRMVHPDSFGTAFPIGGMLWLSRNVEVREVLEWRRRALAAGEVPEAADVLSRCLRLPRSGTPGLDDETLRVNLTGFLWGLGQHTCAGAYINQAAIPAMLAPLLRLEGLVRAPGDAGQPVKDGPDGITIRHLELLIPAAPGPATPLP